MGKDCKKPRPAAAAKPKPPGAHIVENEVFFGVVTDDVVPVPLGDLPCKVAQSQRQRKALTKLRNGFGRASLFPVLEHLEERRATKAVAKLG